MWNIIKAQNYQIKRDNLVVYVFLAGLVFPFLGMVMGADGLDFGSISGSEYMAGASSIFPIILMLLALVLSSRICGWDSTDKTINYEIMAGHSRKEVYFGRVCSALMWTLAGGLLLMAVSLLFVLAVFGWGEHMSLGALVLRIVVALFPLFRLCCEFILLTFLLQDCYKGLVLGFVLFDVSILAVMIYEEFTDRILTVQLASANLLELFNFSNYSSQYINGEDVIVYTASLEPSMLAGSIIISLAVGTACIAIGYIVFCRQDMR